MAGDKKVVIKINLPTSDNKDNLAGSSVRQVTEWNLKRLMITGFILLLFFTGLLYLFLGSDTGQDEIGRTEYAQNEIYTKTGKLKPPADINEKVDVNKSVDIIEKTPELVDNETKDIFPVNKSGIDQANQSGDSERKETSEINKVPMVSEVDINQTKPQKPITNQWVVRAQLANNINNKEPSGDIELPFIVNRTRAKGLFYFTEIKNMQGKSVYHQWNYKGKIVFKKKINILGNRWRASTRKMMSYRNSGDWNVRLLDDKGNIMNEISFTVLIQD